MPGSLTTNGLGDDITAKTPWMVIIPPWAKDYWNSARYAPYRQPGNIKMFAWLQPVKYFNGVAHYRKEVEIPATWRGKRIVLNLERCHWGTRVWVDDKLMPGQDLSLCTPHTHDLSGVLTPGKHTLTVEVDNGYLADVGDGASSITDHSQTNWNGFVGKTELVAGDKVWLSEVQVYPDIRAKTARVVATVANDSGSPCSGELTLGAEFSGKKCEPRKAAFTCEGKERKVELTYALGDDAPLWDEFTPDLITLHAAIAGKDGRVPFADARDTRFGLREIAAEGRQLTLNGRPVMLRGTLDCSEYPLTGYPDMNAAWWRHEYATCKAFGLNHVRFHSNCPPKVAFDVADEMGVYLQVECGVWKGPTPWLTEESKRIVREYGNHPSFMLLVHGNEPSFGNEELDKVWVPAMKALDSRHLVAASTHWGMGPSNQFDNPGGPQSMYGNGDLQNQRPGTKRDYNEYTLSRPKPTISHEPGQWCVFPNLAEIAKYTGVLKPTAYEIVKDFMRANHLSDRAQDFLMASGKFQTLMYKEETEILLRTRSLGGFQMLGLSDFSGQGTAPIGVVDPFWDAKPYVNAEEYRRFSGPVVPLAYLSKRTFTPDETLRAPVSVCQFSAAPLKDCRLAWTVTRDDGSVFAKGECIVGDIPVGLADIGEITCPLFGVRKAAHLKLTVTLPGTEYANDWSFWVYPNGQAPDPGTVKICANFEDALDLLAEGKSVLWMPKAGAVQGGAQGAFGPIFWNKVWDPGHLTHTLGMLIQDRHPALAGFPTAFHSDMQWWDPVTHGKPAVLDGLPPELQPIVQPIDDWNTCRRLGLLFEAKVGPGKLMLCTMDLQSDQAKRPVARQLLASILKYMNTPAFAPKVEVTEAQLRTVVRGGSLHGIKVTASSAHPDNPASNVMDGDPDTIWHNDWTNAAQHYPYVLTIELPRAETLRGVNFLARQDGLPNGRVKTVKVETGEDGEVWKMAVAQATLADNAEWQAVGFPSAVKAKFIRITLLAPQTPGQNLASMAEISLTKK